MSKPTTTPAEGVTSVDQSNDGSLIENVGTPSEIIENPEAEVSADVVDELLQAETQFYELDPETGFRVVDSFTAEDSEGELEAEGDAEAEAAATEDEEVEDTAEAASPEESQEAQPDAEDESPEAEDEPEPFRFKADGSEFTVDSMVTDEDGNLVISPEAFAREIQPHLADRRVWQEKEQEYKKQIAVLDPGVNPIIKEAEVLVGKVNELLADEEALEAFVENFSKNRDNLIAAAEKARLQQELDNLKAEKEGVVRADSQVAVSEQMSLGITTLVDQALELDDYKGLDRAYVSELLTDMQGTIFRAATDAEAQENGFEPGTIVVDYDVVSRVLQREAKRVADTQARTKAKRKNSASSRKPKAPTAPDAKPGRSEGRQAPKTKAEWEANLRKAGL